MAESAIFYTVLVVTVKIQKFQTVQFLVYLFMKKIYYAEFTAEKIIVNNYIGTINQELIIMKPV